LSEHKNQGSKTEPQNTENHNVKKQKTTFFDKDNTSAKNGKTDTAENSAELQVNTEPLTSYEVQKMTNDTKSGRKKLSDYCRKRQKNAFLFPIYCPLN